MNCSELDELGSIGIVETSSTYPSGLQSIIDLFVSLPDEEKRETLIAYAEQSTKWAPHDGDKFDLEDVRKDEECTDTVGVFLSVDTKKQLKFRVPLAPQSHTLTRPMTPLLSR